jgi:hypothetical protein
VQKEKEKEKFEMQASQPLPGSKRNENTKNKRKGVVISLGNLTTISPALRLFGLLNGNIRIFRPLRVCLLIHIHTLLCVLMEIAVSVLIMRNLTPFSDKPIKRKQILILIVSGPSLNLIIQKRKKKEKKKKMIYESSVEI